MNVFSVGPGARKGDSGACLIFQDSKNERYFLRGIVSTGKKDASSSISTFTDISYHLSWLDRIRSEIERETAAVNEITTMSS